MLISYNQEDLELWADFSGDRNPIHFDSEFALSNGLDGCIVHGMLAMLPMKSIFLKNLDTNANSIQITLKNSVPMNETLEFLYLNDKISLKYENKCLYLGKTKSIKSSDYSLLKKYPILSFFTEEILRKKYQLFRKIKGTDNNNLIFWDGILFSIYIQNNRKSPLAHNVSKFLQDEGLNPESYVVYQVNHSLTVYSDKIQEKFNFDEFSYSCLGKDLVRVDNNIYASVLLNLYDKDELIITTEMGLLAKLF